MNCLTHHARSNSFGKADLLLPGKRVLKDKSSVRVYITSQLATAILQQGLLQQSEKCYSPRKKALPAPSHPQLRKSFFHIAPKQKTTKYRKVGTTTAHCQPCSTMEVYEASPQHILTALRRKSFSVPPSMYSVRRFSFLSLYSTPMNFSTLG